MFIFSFRNLLQWVRIVTFRSVLRARGRVITLSWPHIACLFSSSNEFWNYMASFVVLLLLQDWADKWNRSALLFCFITRSVNFIQSSGDVFCNMWRWLNRPLHPADVMSVVLTSYRGAERDSTSPSKYYEALKAVFFTMSFRNSCAKLIIFLRFWFMV